jgi:hypothetical protein
LCIIMLGVQVESLQAQLASDSSAEQEQARQLRQQLEAAQAQEAAVR